MQLPHRPSTLLQHAVNSLVFKRLPGVLIGLAIGFGLVFITHAAEPEACGFGLVQCDENGVIWDFAAVGADNVAQLATSDGLAEAILAFGYFLNRSVLPLLIGVALFVFLYYLARTLIIDAVSTDKREEARKRMLWGLAAFILIASLWGIVNLLTVPQIDRDRSICPDYLGNFCGNLGFERGSSGYSGSSNLDYGNDSSWVPRDTSVGGNRPSTAPPPQSVSALGELLFGEYRDSPQFNFRTGEPRAAGSAVTLATNTSCEAGLNALQTAAGIETLQSGYLLYRSGGTVAWLNVTDATEQTGITYDAEWMQDEIVSASALALVHTHPQAVIEASDLNTTGYPPGTDDFEIMCDDVINDALFVTVDQGQVWVAESTGDMCPRRAGEVDDLPVISTLLHLAVTPAGERNTQFAELYDWDELPSSVRQGLRDYVTTDFSRLSTSEVLLMADDIARDGSMRIERTSMSDFCATF
tara:strand:- start:262 stop:1671 length:1410 start_codon:yes stop_codon:yes gene_type:complete